MDILYEKYLKMYTHLFNAQIFRGDKDTYKLVKDLNYWDGISNNTEQFLQDHLAAFSWIALKLLEDHATTLSRPRDFAL